MFIYMKFNLAGYNATNFVQAQLFYTNGGSGLAGESFLFYRTSSSWTGSTLTWNTPKPALGTSLGSGIPVAASMVVSQGPSGVSSYVSSYF